MDLFYKIFVAAALVFSGLVLSAIAIVSVVSVFLVSILGFALMWVVGVPFTVKSRGTPIGQVRWFTFKKVI